MKYVLNKLILMKIKLILNLLMIKQIKNQLNLHIIYYQIKLKIKNKVNKNKR